MAVVDAYTALNLVNPVYASGQTQTATSTNIVISDGFTTSNYQGTGFTFSATAVTGGTLLRYTEYHGGVLAADALGLSIPATVVQSYIEVNNQAGLFAVALSGDDRINGSVFADKLAGYEGNDAIFGGAGNDRIDGGNGSNSIDGGEGLDIAVFAATAASYQVSLGSSITVNRLDGSADNSLTSIERLAFTDQTIAFDQTAAQGYRLYQAAFDRVPDQAGLSFWVHSLDDGTSLASAATSFIASQEFKGLYGDNPTDIQFVDLLYHNVLDRDADQGGYDYWVGQLQSGSSRASVLVNFSESAENIANVAGAIAGGIHLDAEVQIWG